DDTERIGEAHRRLVSQLLEAFRDEESLDELFGLVAPQFMWCSAQRNWILSVIRAAEIRKRGAFRDACSWALRALCRLCRRARGLPNVATRCLTGGRHQRSGRPTGRSQ